MDERAISDFNNLTKTLCFNNYEFCYTGSERSRREYIAGVNEKYNAGRLTEILVDIAGMIHATVLNISKHDYEPQGASATLLIAEKPVLYRENNAVAVHLDKSHIAAHTYLDYHQKNGISTSRVDVDVATCGDITPLSTLDYLIGFFNPDIITLDYRVRGFTRDIEGKKLYMDHDIKSIQDFIDINTLLKYDARDLNIVEANIFYSKMLKKRIDIRSHLYNKAVNELSHTEKSRIIETLRSEMIEIFIGE